MSIRLTKKRSEILDVLKRTHGTLSASDIHQTLPHIDLVTIYRNLDLFASERMIKRVHLGTDETQYEYQREPHHHAICTNCEKVIHFTLPEDEFKNLLHLKGFTIEEVEVTVRGTCKSKRQK